MTTPDTCCTLVPYFRIHEGHTAAFRTGCEAFVEKTRSEPGGLFYGFSFDGRHAHCREGYEDASSLLFHLDNVGGLLEEALKIADLTRLEVHAPEAQLELLREPLAEPNPQFYTLEMGLRRN